jgi:thiol-disulfide isomerase/thioredoxin
MKKTMLALVVSLIGFNALAYESLEALMADMNQKQVEAIRGYLEANPEAEDAAEARERLIYGLVAVDDYAGALALLEEAYQRLPADKSGLDLSSVFGETVVPMIQLYRMDGRKEAVEKFIATVREDFKNHEMIQTINESLDEFSKAFEQPGVGDTLEMAFTALDGREVNLADLKGKVVLVDFWATWCLPCVRAMPAIKALYAEFQEKGFEIIGISLDSDKEKLEKYLASEGIAWPNFFDGLGWDNEIANRYGIESIPATFLIGPDGLIAGVNMKESAMKEKIAELLAGGEATP